MRQQCNKAIIKGRRWRGGGQAFLAISDQPKATECGDKNIVSPN